MCLLVGEIHSAILLNILIDEASIEIRESIASDPVSILETFPDRAENLQKN